MSSSPKSDYRLVLTTCPDAETADRIAAQLVEAGLAACVNILPGVRSVYRWQGRLERADEHLLLIKTRADHYAQVQGAVCDAHPYELPEVVSVPIDTGSAPYLAWIDALLSAQ